MATISQTDLPAGAEMLSPRAANAEDAEKQNMNEFEKSSTKQSTFKNLGWLDRFLAVWIFLAMAIGIILGNFVENTGPALQKGQFVGVSIPIGIYSYVMQSSFLTKF